MMSADETLQPKQRRSKGSGSAERQRAALARLREKVMATPELPEAVNAADLRLAYNKLREAILSGLS